MCETQNEVSKKEKKRDKNENSRFSFMFSFASSCSALVFSYKAEKTGYLPTDGRVFILLSSHGTVNGAVRLFAALFAPPHREILGDLFLIIFLMKAGARDFMVNVAIIHFKERYCWNTK